MQTNIDHIKTVIQKHSDFLRDTYNVDRIGIFGSIARDEHKETSDVDVLVELSNPLGMFKFIELEEFLSKVIGKKVDLVTNKALKPAIKEEVLQEIVYV
ncbi:nucleotidyltransferase family protein [Candidatus Gottesmanbacteria bacterium]|nr:nucleotidyltransferase family protein [Candidatus Gottesmanbacteria bacterium]